MPDTAAQPCRTPVVLIVFKREDTTARVFEAIRAARPPKLLVIADGPRNDAEREACLRTRAVVDRVDWPCEVMRNFSEANLGCRRRIATGLDWAFSEVEEAIVLEDDCLPHPSFFRYCDELLARYRDDPRVRMISGPALQHGRALGEATYFFSRYPMIWGWASWRRAWKDYDLGMKGWPAFRDGGGLERLFDDPVTVAYWRNIFETLRVDDKPNTWDYQWVFSCFAHGGLVANPNVNLVSNIGHGEQATHTAADPLGHANMPLEDAGTIRHPREVAVDAEADRILFDRAFGGERIRRWYEKERRLGRRLKRRWDALRRAVGLK